MRSPSSAFTLSKLSLLAGLFSLVPFSSVAQPSASFMTKTTATNLAAFHSYAVDVNNDGISDVVALGLDRDVLSVYLANGDGTFRVPTTVYQLSNTGRDLVSGDFDGDGKVDIVVVTSVSQLLFFKGNGDGTFVAPKTTSPLPSGGTTNGRMVTADFNHDGKLDVVVESSTDNPDGSLANDTYYLLEGDGTGGFATPKPIYSANSPSGTYVSVGQAAIGDFDSDGNADIAFVVASNDATGGNRTGTIHVLYGDGTGAFTDSTQYSQGGDVSIQSGDLNSDGRTDLYGYNDTGRLLTLYAQTGRTFATYSSTASYGPSGMADFNGDGRMDLVAYVYGQNPTKSAFDFLLGTTTPGTFTTDLYSAIPQEIFTGGMMVGDFNGDGKPDAALYQYNPGASGGTYTNDTITAALNTTASGNWGNCSYPRSGQGIQVCTPTSSGNSVTFSAAANSFGQLRKIEVWVDGKKLTEQYHTWGPRAYFLYGASLAAGTHAVTFYAADVDNRLQKSSFNLTVSSESTCGSPGTPGVNICKPASGSTVTSPVSVLASSTITGTLARMELWVDGVKKYTETTSKTLSTSVALPAGSHHLTVYAVNTAGTKWSSTETAYVQ